MRRLLLWLLCAIAPLAAAQTQTLHGTVVNSDGSYFNGTFTISLPRSTVVNTCVSPAQVIPFAPIIIFVRTGTFPSTQLLPTSCLSPSIPYYVDVKDASGAELYTDNWFVPKLLGATIDVGTLSAVKLAAGITVSVPSAIVGTPAGNQTITQPAGTSLSINNLTVTGALTTGSLPYLPLTGGTMTGTLFGSLAAFGTSLSLPAGALNGTIGAYQFYSPKGEFDPFAFGAKGDGTTDDTTALQNTLNAAGALGGSVVRLKAGVYKTSSTLVLPYAVQLLGAGNNNCGLGSAPPAGSCINYSGSSYAIKADISVSGSGKDWQIKDLAIWGNNSTDSGIGILGTLSAVPSNYEISNVTVGNFGVAGIYIKGTSYGKIDHVSLLCTATGPAGKIGMDIEPGALYSEVSYFNAINTQTCSGAAIKIAAGNMLYFNQLDLNNDGIGIQIQPAASNSVFNTYFDNTNIHAETSMGVELDATNGSISRIYFRDIIAGTAGSSTSERPIYAIGGNQASADFDGLQVAVQGGTSPTYAIYADCNAHLSVSWSNPTTGAGSYPQSVCNTNWTPSSNTGAPAKQFRNIIVWDWQTSDPDMNTQWGSNYHELAWNIPSSGGNFYGMGWGAFASNCNSGPGLVFYGTAATTAGGARNAQTFLNGFCVTNPNPSGSTGTNKYSMVLGGRIASNPSDGEPGLGIYPDSTQTGGNLAVDVHSPAGSTVFSTDYNGNVNAAGYKAAGTAGFSGTKTAGSCTLTISGGIITNVTGC